MKYELAEELRAAQQSIAAAVTAEFLERHPDWEDRYGDLARTRGKEDAAFHVDFLAAAIEMERPDAFADYARWCAGVLERRGIARSFLAENLRQVGAMAGAVVSAEAAAAVEQTIQIGVQGLDEESTAEPVAHADDHVAAARLVYTSAATQGQRKLALGVARELMHDGETLLDLYEDLFREALYEVGRLWAADGITVAQEHMATATTQYILGVLYEEAPVSTIARGPALITGVEGELHQVGANMVADALDCDGWNVYFLGTNMPHSSILAVIDERKPLLLGISASIVTHTPHVRDLIADVRAQFGPSTPKILVGGRAFRTSPGLWEEIGADGFAPDVRTAVEAARSIASTD